MAPFSSQDIAERTLVAVYPWRREVWEKKFDQLVASGEADPDYAFERKMPKRVYETDADGSEKIRRAGKWVLIPTKDTLTPWGHLINHCRKALQCTGVKMKYCITYA